VKADMPKPEPSTEPPVDFATLLWEELAEVRRLRQNRQWSNGDVSHIDSHAPSHSSHETKTSEKHEPIPRTVLPDQVFENAYELELIGLAFSGGGIRSATFNLGVLQGFADLKLLPMFDYLSTVSGGGYIGSWLEAWIYRAGTDPRVAQCTESSSHFSPIRRVQECLTVDRSSKIDHGESTAIRFLREYSNYLTPRLGFLGADTWTAVAIYLRNLLLNQAILVCFLFLLLLLPHIAVYLSKLVIWMQCPNARYVLPASIFVMILLGQYGIAKNMTNLTGEGPTGEFPPSARQGAVLIGVAGPLFLAAWCLSLWMWDAQLWNSPWWLWLILGVVGFGLTWSLAAFWGIGGLGRSSQPWNSFRVRSASIGFSLISSTVAGMLLWVIADKILKRWSLVDRGIWHVVSFGTPLIVSVFLLVAVLQLGLIGRLAPDPRREWWGRLGGWLLIMTITWASAFALAIYSPLWLMWARKWATFSSVMWILCTATGVLGAKSAKTGSPSSPSWKDTALSVTPYVFIVGLAVGLSTVLEAALAILNAQSGALSQFLKGNHLTQKVAAWIVSVDWGWAQGGMPHEQGTLTSTSTTASDAAYIAAHWQILRTAMNYNLIGYAFVVALVCLFLAWRVDLNEFSMNLFYRNRLVRCYLGASHKFRNPNPFTGFDPSDDLPLSRLRSTNHYSGPFPIVNTSLNLVKGQNLAWQERKAESFVITPLRCGFDTWLERLDLEAESAEMSRHGIQKYGFRRAENYSYPGGFRIGTAVSISGAAASPNMGYQSVPSLAFLMTFFNVRLGFWTGNPRRDSTWTLPGPRLGLFQLLAELFGLTDDEASYVYLSDGGHFENLGLYELIKRRCKFIVVCDADCDGTYAFGDLGNAIRKCREDIGVEITLSMKQLIPKRAFFRPEDSADEGVNAGSDSNDGFSEWHWAIGKIHYNLVDPNAADGVLVYLKTSLTGDEPVDVLNYHRQHSHFPHQTTGDQWFTESQFESYRRLGQHVVEELLSGIQITNRSTGDIFRELEKKWPADRKSDK
jgi:hypothetical protein